MEGSERGQPLLAAMEVLPGNGEQAATEPGAWLRNSYPRGQGGSTEEAARVVRLNVKLPTVFSMHLPVAAIQQMY